MSPPLLIPLLSAGNFVIGMGAFAVIGLLVPLADSFAISRLHYNIRAIHVELFSARHHVHVIDFGNHVALNRLYLHPGTTSQELAHKAAKVRGKMNDHDECHARIYWHGSKESLQRFQAAG